MNGFYDVLRELIDWRAGPDALVLSLYLDVSGDDAHAALEYADKLLALELDPEVDPRTADLARLAKDTRDELSSEIAGARREGYQGVAVFLCASPRLERFVRLRFPFENQGQLGRDPFLRQLLFYAEEYEPSVCVVLEPSRASLCEVHVGDLGRVRAVEPTHGRSLAEEIATVLYKLVSDDPRMHVIFVGPDDQTAHLAASMPAVVRARVLESLALTITPHDKHFLPAVHKALQAYERRAESDAVASLFAARARREPVALGLSETLDAINNGRIKALYVLQRYTGRAWLCDACDRLGAVPVPPVCLSCGASVSPVAAEDHLLDQAAACGASIETVAESAALSEAGGVGALL